ncbi:hypothetical protein ACH5RR_009252 [Cinchona calisaya]|uniref:B30.2/SPRY domain-containing protein n=1 Tax=Cinchona calisaya TaxID=153742 RepID=A0ABD3AH38_9GENT
MDTLRANYNDDEQDLDVATVQPQRNSTIDNGSTELPSISVPKPEHEPESESKPQIETGVKEEAPTASEDLSSDEVSDNIENDNENPKAESSSRNSPNFTKVESDTEEDEDDEEEPPPKKQKQLSSLTSSGNPEISNLGAITTPEAAGAGGEATNTYTTSVAAAKSGSKSSKKSKKKNNNVWTRPTSRKGKKKGKNNGNQNGNNTNNVTESEDKVLITPIPRFPDKNDDSLDAKICLSKVYKAEKVELSEDRMTAGSTKGYRMVRSTRGVVEGAWYFEIKIVHLGETGHTRLGWSTDKGDLQAPVGYDGNSFGYRDIDGSKVHKAVREKYGEEGYKEGDVIGFYINLPEGSLYTPKPPRLIWYKGQKYVSAPDAKDDPPKVVPGSEISFFKNGVCQGTAFKDLFGGRYFPAASIYTLPNQPNCTVKFNFGPDFEFFPEDFVGREVPRPMIEVPYHGLDIRVENGSGWYPTRMCPMLNVVKEQGTNIVEAAEMVS